MPVGSRKFVNLLALAAIVSLCLAPESVIADALNDKASSPFPRIGKVTKAFPTDALCILRYRKQPVLIDLYPENEFWMNLDGQDVKLVPLFTKHDNSKFKFANTRILVKYGSFIETPKPGQIGMDGTIFKKAQIILINGKHQSTIQATGGCDGGSNFGK